MQEVSTYFYKSSVCSIYFVGYLQSGWVYEINQKKSFRPNTFFIVLLTIHSFYMHLMTAILSHF